MGSASETTLPAVEPISPAVEPAPPRASVRFWRRWPVGLAALLAAGLALGVGLHARHGHAAPAFDTLAVDRGDITARVTATGTLSALVTVQVGSQVSGTISALYADFNSHVGRGQIIARIDPALFDAAFEQARANLVAAEGNLAKARAQAADAASQATRDEELAEQQVLAFADRDTAIANAAAARAAVQAADGAVAQARAALHQAQLNLDHTNIVSPIDGSVISRSVDVGQTVAASLQAPTLFTIAEDLAHMQVDTNVAEADVGKLSAGMAATFGVDAFPGRRFAGTVRQIRNAPQTLQNVVTYDAVIDVDNPDGALRPGMTANVSFVYAERDDAVRVPNAALRFRPAPASRAGTPSRPAPPALAPDQRQIWVADGAELRAVPVRTGVTDGSFSELLDGDVHAGERLVVGAPPSDHASRGAGPSRLF